MNLRFSTYSERNEILEVGGQNIVAIYDVPNIVALQYMDEPSILDTLLETVAHIGGDFARTINQFDRIDVQTSTYQFYDEETGKNVEFCIVFAYLPTDREFMIVSVAILPKHMHGDTPSISQFMRERHSVSIENRVVN